MRNIFSPAWAAAFAAALSLSAPETANAEIKIISRVDQNTSVTLEIQRMFKFEASVTLSVRTDPRLVPSARVIEMVESIDMRDGIGVAITRGYDINVTHDLVVAWSGGTAEITKVQNTPHGLAVVGLFKDHQGRIVTPPAESLAAYTTSGQRICFERATIETAPEVVPMSFALLIDRSGSMKDVMSEVREAAVSFIDALPETATCAVWAFSDDWSFAEEDGLGVKACRSSEFDLTQLQAGGRTNLFAPLRKSYEWLSHPSRANHQKAVVIITDGRVNENEEEGEAVAALKGDALTFSYFLGEWEDRWLKGLSDNYLSHKGDLGTQLGRYFEVVSSAYRKQTVLQLRTCPIPALRASHVLP